MFTAWHRAATALATPLLPTKVTAFTFSASQSASAAALPPLTIWKTPGGSLDVGGAVQEMGGGWGERVGARLERADFLGAAQAEQPLTLTLYVEASTVSA